MNESLSRCFTREEVTIALKQIHPTKAPGPDGMSAIFYQKYWSIVGCSITNMVLNVLNSDMSLACLNKTNIALIPKVNNPKKMFNFRPINLCNVVYKLISKTIANRFKAILPHIISENQSAFTPDKLITDNVLMAFELMQFLNHKNAGIDGFMTAKLDISKAFNRVEWGFIQGVMEKLGFNSRWVNLVMKCITSVSYLVIINGATSGNIVPTWGLRQGDPLSPILFLIYTEGLSALINKATRNQLLTSISICRGYPRVTHLLFVDDSILFCKASAGESRELKFLLQKYEDASSQKINTDKSSIFFNPNTALEVKEEIFSTLGPMQDSRHSKYLGLPSFIGRLKIQVFSILKERIGQKLVGWKGNSSLWGGGKSL